MLLVMFAAGVGAIAFLLPQLCEIYWCCVQKSQKHTKYYMKMSCYRVTHTRILHIRIRVCVYCRHM